MTDKYYYSIKNEESIDKNALLKIKKYIKIKIAFSFYSQY